MYKFLRSFSFAYAGIRHCFKTGLNFRVQLLMALLINLAAFLLKVSSSEWALLLICTALVLSLEMMNTAIEKLCDLYTKDFHPEIKIIKDIAAGTVLVSALLATVTGAVILLPKIFSLLNRLH